MSFYVSSLSREDIDAVNNWHWPLTYEGNLDIFAPVPCVTEEMIAFRTKRLKDRFKYAYNTYKKYRQNPEGSDKPSNWGSKTTWLLEVIAKTAEIDITCIPEDLHKVIPYCQQWLNTFTQLKSDWAKFKKDNDYTYTDDDYIKFFESCIKLRDKCYNMIDIFIEGQPIIKRGRPTKKDIANA